MQPSRIAQPPSRELVQPDMAHLIARCVWLWAVRGNEVFFIVAGFLGALQRALALIGMALTFKAILSALAPEAGLQRVGHLLPRAVLELFDHDVTWILGFLVGLAYFLSWLLQRFRDLTVEHIISRAICPDNVHVAQLAHGDDLFLLEDIVPQVRTLVTLVELSLFSLASVTFVALFAPSLLLPLVPFLGLFTYLTARSNRHGVYLRDAVTSGKNAYRASGMLPHEQRQNERRRLAEAQQALRRQGTGSAQVSTLTYGAIMVLITLMIARLGFHLESAPVLPLILVLAIRTLVSYSRQFGRGLAKLLELRTHRAELERLLAIKQSG